MMLREVRVGRTFSGDVELESRSLRPDVIRLVVDLFSNQFYPSPSSVPTQLDDKDGNIPSRTSSRVMTPTG